MKNKDFPKSKGEFKRLICRAIDAQYENEICDLFIKHKHKLEKELAEL